MNRGHALHLFEKNVCNSNFRVVQNSAASGPPICCARGNYIPMWRELRRGIEGGRRGERVRPGVGGH